MYPWGWKVYEGNPSFYEWKSLKIFLFCLCIRFCTSMCTKSIKLDELSRNSQLMFETIISKSKFDTSTKSWNNLPLFLFCFVVYHLLSMLESKLPCYPRVKDLIGTPWYEQGYSNLQRELDELRVCKGPNLIHR